MKIYNEDASASDDIGIADNDIDAFLKRLLESVVRESIQNSNDEALIRPAKMAFDLTSVQVKDIPDVLSYKEVLQDCLSEAASRKAVRAREFFENAIKVLDKDKVNILTISDSGTKGAGGEFKEGEKFYTLLISKGQTEKQDIFSAGSFGIGKNASIAGSQLRLVFYSSVFEEKGQDSFYCMGKSILTTRKDHKNNKKQ